MENTTPTSRPVAERTDKVVHFTIEELENNQGFHVISPEGYIFGFKTAHDMLQFVVDITVDGIVSRTMYGDKCAVESGRISCWTPDDWINPGWNHGVYICRTYRIANAILVYVEDRWIQTKS